MSAVKLYSITVSGFDVPVDYVAETASKARWKCFIDITDAGYFTRRDGFREFLSRTSTLHHGDAPECPYCGKQEAHDHDF